MQIRQKQKIDNYFGYFLIGLLLPFTRLLGITLRRDHSVATPPRRILFIKLLGLGSLLVASESIIALRKRYPDARLILLTDANIAAGVAPFHLFDEIVSMETGKLGATLVGITRFLFRCWACRGLWVIDLEVYSKLTTVLALLTLARNRFGFYLPPVPFRKYLNTHNIPFDQSAYLGDNYLYMAAQVAGVSGVAAAGVVPAGSLAFADTANEVLSASVHSGPKPYIILNNTCSGLADVRRMPEAVFAQICQWILEHTTYDIALLGAPVDKDPINRFIWNDPVLYSKKERIVNLAGGTKDFEEYYRFLREKGACMITIDSGPLHIARQLGLPTLSVWGPTDPANYLKIQPHERHLHLSIYLGTPCSPCVHRYEYLPCGGDNICMKQISAAAIIVEIRELLRRIGTPLPV